MDLLVYLAERHGQVVERDAIIKDVWRGAVISDEAISRSIYLIRRALSDGDTHREAIIETIPKRGYRLIGEVRSLDPDPAVAPLDAAPAAPMKDPQAAPSASAPAASVPSAFPKAAARTSANRWITLVLLVAVAAIYSVSGTRMPWIARTPSGISHPPADRPKSLLVLPLTDVDQAPDAAYLSAGLSDEIAGGLGSIEGLRVVGMNSATRARAAHESYEAIGRQFSVATVLDGSIETKSDAITLRIRLIDTASGNSFDQRTYVGSFATSAALRQSVIGDVAAALGVEPVRRAHAAAIHDPAPDAYRLFLQGRYYARLNNAGGYRQAHDYFLQAVRIDPEFAAAWAALGTSSVLMIDFGNRSREDAVREGQPAARRAAELQPDLPEAQAALGLVALYDNRFEESADALRRATSLRPSYAQAHMWLGRLYFVHGDVGRAAAAYQRAYDLDPEVPIVNLNLGMALDMQGRYPLAAHILEKGIANAPDFANLYWAEGHVAGERGEFEEAATAYRKAIELGADYSGVHAQYSRLLVDLGDTDAALVELSRAEALSGSDPEVWAARVHLAAASALLPHFLDRPPKSGDSESDEFWRALATAEIELLRGNARAARAIYESAHIEEKVDRPELNPMFDTLGGPAALLYLACAYQLTGDAHHAEQLIERAESSVAAQRARGINANDSDYLLAAAAAMRGDQIRALALLRSARAQGWRDLTTFKRDPRFSRIRNQLTAFTAAGPEDDRMATAARQ